MKYNNTYVAKELNDIAFLYGQKGDKFRERAYKRASEGISSFSGNLKKVKDFTQFPHIGVNIAKTIEDVLAGRKTKKKKLLKDKSLVPVEVLELTKLSGIGQKKAADLYRKHKIVSIDQLKKKIKKKTITDMKLVEAVKSYNKNNERLPLYMADATAKQFYSELLQFNLDFEIHEAGSLRRRKSTVKDIDLIISAERHVLDRLVSNLRNKFKILVEGTSKVRVSYNVIEGFTKVIDLVLCTPEEFGSALLYFTGSKGFNVSLRSHAKRLGYKLNEHCLERLKDKKKLYFKDEEKLFEKLQVPYVPAVCRVDGKAVGRSFDNIIFSSDIVGQLHNHTTFSDGKYSPEEFASLSLSQDVEFIAISDHSPATGGVGVKKEKLKQYVEAIRSTRRKFADKGLTVYTSMEVELSKSGMLDKNINRPMYKEFDFVFLSAHRGTAGVDITERLVTAIEYCYRHDIRAIIAHPSNRLLVSYAGSGKVLAREGSVPDWERIFELCAKTNTLLEINAQPTRMDLDVSLVVQAKKAGCRFVINADSHDGLFLNTEYGVWIAQAAWLTTKSVVNSNHSQFISWLK